MKENNLVNIIIKVLMALLMLLGIVFVVSALTGSSPDGTMSGDEFFTSFKKAGDWVPINKYLNPLFYFSAIIMGLTILLAISSPILNLISNPRNILSFGVVLVVVAIVVGISYFISSDAVVGSLLEKKMNDGSITTQTIKFVDAGLILTYIVGSITVLSVIFSSVRRLFK